MSLELQMEQHRLAVEKFREDVRIFDESKKDFDKKIKDFDLARADCDARIIQFEEANESIRLLASKYNNVLASARRLLEEVNLERGCEGDFHNVLHELLIDLQKAVDNGN